MIAPVIVMLQDEEGAEGLIRRALVETKSGRKPVSQRPGSAVHQRGLYPDVEGAGHSGHGKGRYLAAQYRRIAARRGKKRALVALGHTILIIVYHILMRREPYRELGVTYFDDRNPQRVERRYKLNHWCSRHMCITDVIIAANNQW